MGKFVLIFILIVGLGTFFLTSESFKQQTNEENHVANNQHRGTWVDDQGQLHVMGLILGKSTVRDAEIALRSRSDTAIFMYPEKSTDEQQRFRLNLEAYFPSIADHSKIVLVLDVGEEALEAIRQRGTSPRIYPNGVARVNLSNLDILEVKQLKFRTLKLIPSVQLDASMLEARFGKPASTRNNQDQTINYYYPNIGLDALIKPDAKDILTFSWAQNEPINPTTTPKED